MKNLRLIRSNFTPPGGWRFEDPDTRYFYGQRYRTFDQLLSHIKNYRAQNGLDPIPKIRSTVECWLCNQPNMERHCREAPQERTPSQYVSGAKAAANVIAAKAGQFLGISRSPFASQEVAEKRAAICVRCQYNQPNEDDTRARKYTDAFVQGLVGNRKTPQDGSLFSCGICSCPLRPKVHVADRIIERQLNPHDRYRFPNGAPGLDGKPLYCWQVNPIADDDSDADDSSNE